MKETFSTIQNCRQGNEIYSGMLTGARVAKRRERVGIYNHQAMQL
jgi:hypothetical protein